MHLWEFISIVGIVFLILEVFIPSMFFLNFSLAAFITAGVSVFVKDAFALVIVFFVLSFVSFAFLRPLLVKRFAKNNETGVSGKYIGKCAKAETEITENSGVITIYGERWEARSEDCSVIPQGNDVKIIRNDSLVMYVQKV
jgi:membrane protein implicated in regulation of membrane protease activity